MNQYNLNNLRELEAESIHIIREVAAEFENPVMLYSIGKDSSVMVRLAEKAFAPGKVPFPLMHIDSKWKFKEMVEFRDKYAKEKNWDLIVHYNEKGFEEGVGPFTHGSKVHTDIMKTQALLAGLDKYKFDALGLRKLLLNKGYLITIFRGIYYLKSYEEKKFNTIKYSPYELLSAGLKLKKVKWYFALNSALKFLNLTHEVFSVNYIINDTFNRINPVKIAGTSFFFIKIKPSLFFGIKKIKTSNKFTLNHSDLEKTLLDFIYLKRNIDLKEFKFNKSLFLKYLSKYDKATKTKINKILQWK
jgi:hypothetical protein